MPTHLEAQRACRPPVSMYSASLSSSGACGIPLSPLDDGIASTPFSLQTTGDVGLMLRQSFREDVASVRRNRRSRDRPSSTDGRRLPARDGRDSRSASGAGPACDVAVVRRVDAADRQRRARLLCSRQRVLDRRIHLQRHSQAQAIVDHRSDMRTIRLDLAPRARPAMPPSPTCGTLTMQRARPRGGIARAAREELRGQQRRDLLRSTRRTAAGTCSERESLRDSSCACRRRQSCRRRKQLRRPAPVRCRRPAAALRSARR